LENIGKYRHVPLDSILEADLGKKLSQKSKLKRRKKEKNKINFCKTILSVLTACP